MEKSEHLINADRLYLHVCKVLKQYADAGVAVPTKESFLLTLNTVNKLISGHKSLLTAIGKL